MHTFLKTTVWQHKSECKTLIFPIFKNWRGPIYLSRSNYYLKYAISCWKIGNLMLFHSLCIGLYMPYASDFHLKPVYYLCDTACMQDWFTLPCRDNRHIDRLRGSLHRESHHLPNLAKLKWPVYLIFVGLTVGSNNTCRLWGFMAKETLAYLLLNYWKGPFNF